MAAVALFERKGSGWGSRRPLMEAEAWCVASSEDDRVLGGERGVHVPAGGVSSSGVEERSAAQKCCTCGSFGLGPEYVVCSVRRSTLMAGETRRCSA